MSDMTDTYDAEIEVELSSGYVIAWVEYDLDNMCITTTHTAEKAPKASGEDYTEIPTDELDGLLAKNRAAFEQELTGKIIGDAEQAAEDHCIQRAESGWAE